MNILLVCLGGALGALCRYWMSKWINSLLKSRFPFATLIINILGSFVLGYTYSLSYFSFNHSLFFQTGFLGAFTTFSTFAVEAIELSKSRKRGWLILYVALSLFLSLFFFYIGTVF